MDFKNLMEYQKMVQQRLHSEEQEDRKIDIMTIINQLTSGPKNIVQKEQVIVEAVSRGITEEEVGNLLKKLIQENIIYESSPGYLKKR